MIGVAAIAFLIVIVGALIVMGAMGALTALGTEWMRLRRKMRAMQSGATDAMIWPEHYQPRTVGAAWREPIDFEATKPCPHCGFFDTHNMAKPTKFDHEDSCTVRRCRRCGHVWGEK